MVKKIITLNIFFIFIFICNAKDIKEENIPTNIRKYVTTHYPTASDIEWKYDSKRKFYKAKFELGNTDRDVKLEISSNGKLLYSKEDIPIESIPVNIKNYIKTNYDNAVILGGNKVYSNGSSSYDIGIVYRNIAGFKRHNNIIFDIRGNVIEK